MSRTKRIEILKAARTLAAHEQYELAAAMFALVGVSYVQEAAS